MTRLRNTWLLPVSVILALLLGLLPLPVSVRPIRPYWLALVLMYWVIETPGRVGIGFAFVMGVLADFLYGGLLGEQALRLVVMSFIVQRFRARSALLPDAAAGVGHRWLAIQRLCSCYGVAFDLGSAIVALELLVGTAIGNVVVGTVVCVAGCVATRSWESEVIR